MKDRQLLFAVDGRRVSATTTEEAASLLIDGPPGPITLTLRDPDGQVGTHRLQRRTDEPSEGGVSHRCSSR